MDRKSTHNKYKQHYISTTMTSTSSNKRKEECKYVCGIELKLSCTSQQSWLNKGNSQENESTLNY